MRMTSKVAGASPLPHLEDTNAEFLILQLKYWRTRTTCGILSGKEGGLAPANPHQSFRLSNCRSLLGRFGGANLFRGHLGLHEKQEIVASTGFGICSGHIESAKWMNAN